jgi:ribonuclease J
MTTLKMTPLGGLGETGALNCMLYENDDTAFVVDCGVAFPDESLPGVGLVIPDFSVLDRLGSKLKALVLTHGHEDHIGAIPYFLKRFDVPLYGLPFTLGVIRNKLPEVLESGAIMRPITYGKSFTIGDVSIEAVFVNHSIPDASGLFIRSGSQKIMHLTDYKIDHAASNGRVTDLARFQEIGREGLDLLLLDSTNAFTPGWTHSESLATANLVKTMTKIRGRVVACLFASNVHRVQSLIECARITGRKIAFTGRSAKAYTRVASALDLLQYKDVDVYDVEEMDQFADHEVLVLVTGSQAEPRSVLGRMARGMFKPFKLRVGDTVLMSSRVIPGNEGKVFHMLDDLAMQGANVIVDTWKDPIHASGHAYQDELRETIRLLKPRKFVPIHGGYRHLMKMKELAQAEGMAEVAIKIILNGQTLALSSTDWEIKSSGAAGRRYIAENTDREITPEAISRRKKMSFNGLIAVSVIFDVKKNRLIPKLMLKSEGVFGGIDEGAALKHLEPILAQILADSHETAFDQIEKMLKVEIRNYYRHAFQIRPEVLVMIHQQ